MTTQQIANRLVELCRQGQFESAQKELFANDAVSLEPYATPDFEKETKGLDAIIEKGKKWMAMVQEIHDLKVSDPLIATNSFALTMYMSVAMKGGHKMEMTELCVYQTKDGRVISETFCI